MYCMFRPTAAIIRYTEPSQSPFFLFAILPYSGQCLHTGSALYRLGVVYVMPLCYKRGTQKRSYLRHYAISRKITGSSPDEVDFCNWPNPSQPHYGHGVDSASNRNEYQESSLGVKGGRRVRLTSHPYVSRLSRKCGSHLLPPTNSRYSGNLVI
jgi:hypothetical protein